MKYIHTKKRGKYFFNFFFKFLFFVCKKVCMLDIIWTRIRHAVTLALVLTYDLLWIFLSLNFYFQNKTTKPYDCSYTNVLIYNQKMYTLLRHVLIANVSRANVLCVSPIFQSWKGFQNKPTVNSIHSDTQCCGNNDLCFLLQFNF